MGVVVTCLIHILRKTLIHVYTSTKGTCIYMYTCISAMYGSVQCDAYTHTYMYIHVLKVQYCMYVYINKV